MSMPLPAPPRFEPPRPTFVLPAGPQRCPSPTSPWPALTRTQERRAKELLSSQLESSLPIADVAQACSLSRGHFSKAFKRTTGLSPHAWRMSCRIEHAESMLRDGGPSLADIALACGFSDQAHFTRAFRQRIGVSPGVWRRMLDG